MELLAVLIIVAVILIIEQLIFRKFLLRGVSYSVRFSVHEAMEGETIEIIEEVINDKKLPVPWLKTEICTSRWLKFSGSSSVGAGEERFVPSIFSLRPKQKYTRVRKVTALKRGLFSLKNVSVVATDLFGFITLSKTIAIDDSVRILPTPYELYEGDLSSEELIGEITVRRFLCEDPFLISGPREYTGREPMNRIHWSGTARGARIMAYKNDFSTENEGAILLNLQKSALGEPRPVIPADMETYIKAAAFIIQGFSEKRMAVSLGINGSCPGGVFISGGREQEDYRGLLRGLSDTENYCDRSFSDFVSGLKLEGYTDIFVLTAFIDEEMLGFARYQKRLGRNVIFYCNDIVSDDLPIIRMGRVNRFYFMNSEE